MEIKKCTFMLPILHFGSVNVHFGVYIVDVETYEIVYMNEFLKEQSKDYTGEICYMQKKGRLTIVNRPFSVSFANAIKLHLS